MKTLLNSIFKKKIPVISSELSPLTIILLDTWIFIKLHGVDAIQHLHNQFTCDVKNLKNNQYSFSAHCNAQGKIITNMYVFYYNTQEIAYIEPKNIYEKQISIIQKYAIFSNIVITPDYNSYIIGITGINARKYLNQFFFTLPDCINTVIHHQDAIIMHFHLPIERFLLIITNKNLLISLLNKPQPFSIQYNDYYQWILLDIESGYPYIDSATSELFFPQSINLDKLNGISFNKGCFIGQEIIARIQYNKLNKQLLYHLQGKLNENNHNLPLLQSGDSISIQINNNKWKKIGTILQICQIKNNLIYIQAILNKSILHTYHLTDHKARIGQNCNLDINLIN